MEENRDWRGQHTRTIFWAIKIQIKSIHEQNNEIRNDTILYTTRQFTYTTNCIFSSATTNSGSDNNNGGSKHTQFSNSNSELIFPCIATRSIINYTRIKVDCKTLVCMHVPFLFLFLSVIEGMEREVDQLFRWNNVSSHLLIKPWLIETKRRNRSDFHLEIILRFPGL